MSIRNNSVDTWKGIAIIAVIGIHATSSANLFSPDNSNYWTGLLFRSILNFAVALFFAFSGYFATSADKIWGQGLFKHYYYRLSQLWIPYVLWTGVYLLLHNRAALFDYKQIAKALFLGTGIGIGYFVIVLSSLIVLHPLLRTLTKNALLALGSIVTAVSLVILYFIKIEYHGNRYADFPYTALPFTTWMLFYYLGYYMKSARIELSNNILLSLICISFVLNLAESILITVYIAIPSLAVSQVKFTTFFYSVCVILFALRFGAGRLDTIQFFAWAGRRSYMLYLCHLLFLGVIGGVLDRSSFLHNLQILHIPISIALTLFAASTCIAIAEVLLPSQLFYFISGFKKEANRVPGSN